MIMIISNIELFILCLNIGVIGSVIGMLLCQLSVWRYLRKNKRIIIKNWVYTAYWWRNE